MGLDVDLFYALGGSFGSSKKLVVPRRLFKSPWVNVGILIFYMKIVIHLLFKPSRFDLVHIHGDWLSFFFARVIKLLVKADFVVASHHGGIHDKRWYKPLAKFSLAGIDAFYATGRIAFQYFKSLNLEVDMTWRSSGVEKTFLETSLVSSRKNDVVWVGSFVSVKNPNLLLDIAISLPNVSFTMVGDGALYAGMVDRVEQLSLRNVIFLGRLNVDALSEVLSNSKIIINTSNMEGTPTAVLEGMACGCFPIVSDCTDYSGLVTGGVNGEVVQLGNVNEFNRAIVSALSCSPSEMQSISMKNRRIIYETFSWERVVSDLNLLFKINE